MKCLNKKHLGLLMLIFPIAIISKIFQFNFLSEKYFIDSNKILDLINGNTNAFGGSYHFTANFFKTINIFGFDSLIEWSIFLTFTFNMIIFCLLLKENDMKFKHYIYTYISIFLLDVFAFNLNKEIVQLIFLFPIYIIFLSNKISTRWKFVIACFVIWIESLLFRSYYILLILSFVLTFIFLNKKNNKNRFKILFSFFFFFLLALNISKYILPNMYFELLNVRNGYEMGLIDANTLIKSIFPNDSSFFHYSINYLFNSVRIFFPFELIIKGIKYIPFIVYQLINMKIVFNSLKNINVNVNNNNILFLSFILGYLLISATFEPDFGSVVRHESVYFLFFFQCSILSDNFKGDEFNE